MPEADKNKIPRNLHGMKDKQNPEITIEQVLANSLVTIAACIQELAEATNDICANLDAIREVTVKRGLHDGILAPDEAKSLLAEDDDESEVDESEK